MVRMARTLSDRNGSGRIGGFMGFGESSDSDSDAPIDLEAGKLAPPPPKQTEVALSVHQDRINITATSVSIYWQRFIVATPLKSRDTTIKKNLMVWKQLDGGWTKGSKFFFVRFCQHAQWKIAAYN